VNVSAREQQTGKEQKITITGSSGLDKTEIDRMVEKPSATLLKTRSVAKRSRRRTSSTPRSSR
jgi:molecular chaperone DnaK (HSP70)